MMLQMKKIILRAAVAFIIICFLMSGFIIYKIKTNMQWLVTVKYFLFTNFTNDAKLFKISPQGLFETKFKIDSPSLIKDWSYLISHDVYYMKNIDNNTLPSSVIDKAKSIIILFSRNGGVSCAADISLIEKIKQLPEGHGYGCCSDHTKVFIALGSVLGLFVREVHTAGHVTNEFYDNELNKWIWIDPLFAILAKNEKNEYLSLMEIRDLYYKNKQVHYEFFGNDAHYFNSHLDPRKFEYFDNKENFSNIMITWGNNVLTEDKFCQRINFLPKFIRQFVGIKVGIIPSYIMYVDENNILKAQELLWQKYICNSIFIFFIVCSVAFPTSLVIIAIFSRREHLKNIKEYSH
jgi:hypothetical protein